VPDNHRYSIVIGACDFPPIKALRDLFNKKHKYRIIAEETAGKSALKKANFPKTSSVKKNKNKKP